MIAVAANMLQPVGGVSHVRVVYPLQAMRSDPTVLTQLVTGGDIKMPGSDMPRIFVLHRPTLSGDRGASEIRKLLADGWVVVTEFDDHPDHFGMLNADDELAFRGVHAVQTSTEALGAILRTRNPEVMVFPNMVRALPDVRNFRDPQVLTLFFGALNRERDWAPLMPALNDVAEKAGERLRFRVVHDQGFFDALHTPHKRFTPICDYDTYLSLLGECEISLMPLADTPFNRAKSDLKFIEAGACRVAALASHIVYGDSIEDGRTGLLFHNAERAARPTAAPGGDAGTGAWSGRRGTALRRRRAHVGLSGGAANRVVPLALGAAGGVEQRSLRPATGGAAVGRRRTGGNGDTALTLAAAGARLPSYGKNWRLSNIVLSLGFSPQARQT